MLIRFNGETIILKSNMKYQIKTLELKAMKLTYKKYNILFELTERKVESKGPCLIYKTNMLNLGFT